jgi:hypothetical protein
MLKAFFQKYPQLRSALVFWVITFVFLTAYLYFEQGGMSKALVIRAVTGAFTGAAVYTLIGMMRSK